MVLCAVIKFSALYGRRRTCLCHYQSRGSLTTQKKVILNGLFQKEDEGRDSMKVQHSINKEFSELGIMQGYSRGPNMEL